MCLLVHIPNMRKSDFLCRHNNVYRLRYKITGLEYYCKNKYFSIFILVESKRGAYLVKVGTIHFHE